MLAIAGILTVSIAIAMLEVPGLKKKKWKKELWFFFVLLFFGAGLSIAQSLNVKIPNPLDWISFMYKPLSDSLTSLLK
ncbi:hypothetical protein RB620_12340 [Paenibacillus sp. LHD-117]|uniref:hypothetical protein n=1 Tax=Paenibacillus sp. LHD-117 TaxID=3071412 RepID=UPI0027E11272|nr:hypothetical protein [Paenibacillus sp. LHD-117]MDQ6420226.1 hypothetical protein [Paenibacillus sp. LHD-117]